MIGIYHGYEKPHNANIFLEDFITDVVSMTENGFYFNGKKYGFKIKCFICDVSAKSFICYTKGHSENYSCSKCDIEGTYDKGRVCFPDVNFTIRTDDQFRLKVQPEHHNGTRIIEKIPDFNMITDFVIDPMHLLYLGIMKKMINLWFNGKPSCKLAFNDCQKISEHLESFQTQMPCEFRKPRSILEYKRWKATEFRMFLLYLGVIVLKDVLKTDLYYNFLTLHVSMTILSNQNLQPRFINQAKVMIIIIIMIFLRHFQLYMAKKTVPIILIICYIWLMTQKNLEY